MLILGVIFVLVLWFVWGIAGMLLAMYFPNTFNILDNDKNPTGTIEAGAFFFGWLALGLIFGLFTALMIIFL